MASVVLRPLEMHDFPSEAWKQASLQVLVLSQVELAISANDLFALKPKIRRSSVKCSWRIEGESPLYTCPDPDALQLWTSLTTLTRPFMQHNRKPHLIWLWFKL